jgi:nucleotide-binding universal stress UspA family protein
MDPATEHTMIRTLLVPFTATDGDAHAMSTGIALAEHHDAHLSIVVPVTLPVAVPGPWNLGTGMRMSEVYAAVRDEANEQADELRRRLAGATISWDVRVDEAHYAEPPGTMAAQARNADLSVLTAPRQDARDAAVTRAFFSALLFESGRPVLVVPSHHPIELPLRHAVVAWKPTRESSRALHDALMLLRAATSVDLVMVDPVGGEEGQVPGADIATHLARHGVIVNVVGIPSGTGTVANALLRHAAHSDAQLLVAGGYGHSRLREWVLGGTTRELIQALHLPVLFSH